MKSKTENHSTDMMSLVDHDTGELYVPKGVTAIYDAANGPVQVRGVLRNDGEISIKSNKFGKVIIIAPSVVNNGNFKSDAQSVSLCVDAIENAGNINVGDQLLIIGAHGLLDLTGSGYMKADTKLQFNAPLGITVSAGNYLAPAIEFNAEQGRVKAVADSFDGEVTANAQDASVSTKSGTLKVGQNRLLAGNHVYYNAGGGLSLSSINHGSDTVALLSLFSVDVMGTITAGDLTVGAGVYFEIDGVYPPNPAVGTDADKSWNILNPDGGFNSIALEGAVTCDNLKTHSLNLVFGGTLTASGDVEIVTGNQAGDVRFLDDVDVDGKLTVLANEITFLGEDVEIDKEVILGNPDHDAATIKFEDGQNFTAHKSVKLYGYKALFTIDEFTMDGGDPQDKLTTSANTLIDATGTISVKGDVNTTRNVNIVLLCDGDVGTGGITIDNSDGSGFAGRLGIKANRNGGSSQFVIGGDDDSNGANGPITIINADKGGSEQDTRWYGGVYIRNKGDGGIKLTNATDIAVSGDSSKTGGIILDADEGEIDLPTGTLSADGSAGYAGSVIQLLADSIDTKDGTIISASDDGTSEIAKNIQLAASTIKLSGSNGLTIKADGGGNAGYPTSVQILPKGAVTVETSNDDDPVNFYILSWLPNGEFNNNGAVDFDGGGSGKLYISCNGSHSKIALSAYPLSFNNGETTIECKGEEDHQIQILKYGSAGDDGLQFNGGDVTIDAGGDDGGDGGIVTINIDHVLRTEDGKCTIKADGDDEGNGGQIDFYPGAASDPLLVGLDDEQFAFSAKGGATSGNGGTINLYGWTASFEVHGATNTSTPVDVSAPGAEGDGGTINIVAYGNDGLNFSGTASYLKADSGTSSGNGGTVSISAANEPITIDTGSEGSVSLSAISNGDGNGGTIDITAWAGINAESASVAVTAGGNGTGGSISLNAGYSTFTLNGGELHADGGDTGGNGGLIHLEGGTIQLPAQENTLLTANGIGGGNGGTIEVITQWASVDFGTGDGQLNIQAKAGETTPLMARASFTGGNSNGGELRVIQANTYTVDANGIFVHSAENGNGGTIHVECVQSITCNSPLSAYGSGSGTGGTIELEADEINIGSSASFDARGGETGGDGGTISIECLSEITLGITIDASGRGTGNGGNITIEATQLTLNLSTGAPHIKANAGSSGGDGGTITVNTGQINNLDGQVEPLIFEAMGSDEGAGGRVTINYPDVFFLVNRVVKVDSGWNASSNVFGGSITLSGVTAYRHLTSHSGLGEVIWSVNETPSTTDLAIAAAANSLPGGFRSALDGYAWNIYAFASESQYDLFFHRDLSTEAPNALGVTDPYVCSIWLVNANSSGNSYPQGTTVHELGHALDAIWGYPSGGSSFATAVATTKAALDAQDPNCASEYNGTIACSVYPSLTNWQRFIEIVTNGYYTNAAEQFAYLFESKACVAGSLNGDPSRMLVFPNMGAVTTYFDNLW